jgi:hypothetical protein
MGPLTSSQLTATIFPSFESSQRTAHMSLVSALIASSDLSALALAGFAVASMAALGGILMGLLTGVHCGMYVYCFCAGIKRHCGCQRVVLL